MNARTTDIVFLFPPADGNVGVFKNHLGVAYLRAALAKEKILTKQYVNSGPGTVDDVVRDVLNLEPAVVGFTVYDANFPLSLALARSIKQRQPDVKVVFGGPSATLFPQGILKNHSVVDACVIGEAEETGARIFTKFLSGSSFEQPVPGVAFRRDGAVICGSLAPLVGTSCTTLPGRSALDSTQSPYLSGILTDGRAGILTGRGCTHHCQYCCFAALGRKKLRLHSMERVLAELEFIAEHQKRTGERYMVAVQDDAFTLIPDRAKPLCQAIADKNLGLVLSCITRADTLDEELIRLMHEAGFATLAFGLESAVPSVLRAIGKVRPPDWPDSDLAPERDYVKRVRTSVLTAKKHGLKVGVSIILGLPTETADKGAATLDFVNTLPIDFYIHNLLWVFPGTPLWETHDRYGIRCSLGSTGLATTTEYAYDVTRLRPRPKCTMERNCRLVRLQAADALFACRSTSLKEPGISAAVVTAAELCSRTAEWLAGILDVGSIVVQVYPPLKRTEQAARINSDWLVFNECLAPARRYIQMLKRASGFADERWMVTCSEVDLYCSHKPKLLSVRATDGPVQFVNWLKGIATSTLCEISDYLRQPDELEQFLKEIDGNEIGARLRRMPVLPSLKYAGRWLGGPASCLSLTRIEIDGEERVRCCRHGEPIGRVGDTKEALAGRLADLAGKAEQRRGCNECPNSHCPRCPFPGVVDETYCSIMSKQARSLGFLNHAYLYSRVPSILTIQQDKFGGD
jgi:anaerobic magnesium-protoporphyrin IX monomethyl ester cyclase